MHYTSKQQKSNNTYYNSDVFFFSFLVKERKLKLFLFGLRIMKDLENKMKIKFCFDNFYILCLRRHKHTRLYLLIGTAIKLNFSINSNFQHFSVLVETIQHFPSLRCPSTSLPNSSLFCCFPLVSFVLPLKTKIVSFLPLRTGHVRCYLLAD
jgi:hypothetical protein